MKLFTHLLTFFILTALANPLFAQTNDPLPSWNEGEVKSKIIDFVHKVTTKASPDYVAPSKRIATFDNDGTLWVEYPTYTQVLFAFDRVKELAPLHPEWKTKQPFKALLEGDMKTVGKSGMKGLVEILMATHSGMSADAFNAQSAKWLKSTKNPHFKHLYMELVYQPQLELLHYLRANGFKTFIVSGGGVAFMRSVSQEVYGIPPYQVIGSSIVSKYQKVNGKNELIRLPKINFINDEAGKPVGIYNHIGQRPIFAFGNSDHDMEMIEYTKEGKGLTLALFVHHTDASREFAYDRKSHVGTLDKALDLAKKEDWIIVDMKKDWKLIFPFDLK